MPDDTLNRQLADLENWGKQQYGEEDWNKSIKRLRDQVGDAGIPEPLIRQALKDPNAAANFFQAGREARLQQLQAAQDSRSGNAELARELDMEERAIRQKEREAYRKMKGR